MSVHYNPARAYTPQGAEEQWEFSMWERRPKIEGQHVPKCGKCGKRRRGSGHDCKNGK